MRMKSIYDIIEEAQMVKFEGDTLGIAREDMPQIHGEDYPKLLDFLETRGIHANEETVTVKTLRPSQKEFDEKKVAKMKRRSLEDLCEKPILVGFDGFVLDGHHRWKAIFDKDSLNPIQILRISKNAADALSVLHNFNK